MEDYVIFQISRTAAAVDDPIANPPAQAAAVTQTTSATFQIDGTKCYVPIVPLSIESNIKFLKNIKQRFKETISWNKYRSEITTQPKNNKLGYITVPTFRNINRLFTLSFKNGHNESMRSCL